DLDGRAGATQDFQLHHALICLELVRHNSRLAHMTCALR
ncbi:hypothetical protein, partial [Raoultella ornithinolytica]